MVGGCVCGNPSNPTLEKMDCPLRRSRMDENGRHGRSLGIPIHQGLDEREQAGAGGPLNADSRHMASELNFEFLPDSSHMADGRQEQQATRLGFLTSF